MPVATAATTNVHVMYRLLRMNERMHDRRGVTSGGDAACR